MNSESKRWPGHQRRFNVSSGIAPAGTITSGASVRAVTPNVPAGSIFVNDPSVVGGDYFALNQPVQTPAPAPWYMNKALWIAAGIGALYFAGGKGRR